MPVLRHSMADLLTRPGNTVCFIGRLLGVSRATIYTYVPRDHHPGAQPPPCLPYRSS